MVHEVIAGVVQDLQSTAVAVLVGLVLCLCASALFDW